MAFNHETLNVCPRMLLFNIKVVIWTKEERAEFLHLLSGLRARFTEALDLA